MLKLLTCLFLLCSVFFAGCSDNKPAKQETLMDNQIKAMEKAKAVEQVLQDAEQAHRKQMEEQQR
jgi:hypothetical protein